MVWDVSTEGLEAVVQPSASQHPEDVAPLLVGLGTRHHLYSGLALVNTILQAEAAAPRSFLREDIFLE